ncbi:RtcB family protein [bacterium]|nr:RtcB family protein [bacterium]
MKKIISDTKKPVKIWTEDVDYKSLDQLRNIANMPFIHKHVAVMPDVHLGKGATVGSVIATEGAIMPCAVGVDIGCGMSAIKLPIPLGDFKENDTTVRLLRDKMEEKIPVGFNSNTKQTSRASKVFKTFGELKAPLESKAIKRAHIQMGSLGGGNHFIELCEDTEGNSWVMLHSGSRYIGNAVAQYHIGKAKGLMKKMFISLPDMDLAYFAQGEQEFDDYIHDLLWCQRYAKENRKEMMTRVLEILIEEFGLVTSPMYLMKDMIDCHHNYTEIENHYGKNVWVTRKGAVRARVGDKGIIPGSMGAKSFIVSGKGNPESFCSCSHGAGRKHSRTQAKKLFTKEDLIAQTEGVDCKKDESVLDEIPSAYKDIEEVMKNQSDLVEVDYQLKQFMCIKG